MTNPILTALAVFEKDTPSPQAWESARAVLSNAALWEKLWEDNNPEHTRAAQYAIAAMDLVEVVPAFVTDTQKRLAKETARYPLLLTIELTAVFNGWVKHTPTPTQSLLELDKQLRTNVGYGSTPKNMDARVEQALFAHAVDVAVQLYTPALSTPVQEFLLSSVFYRDQKWRQAVARLDALMEKGFDPNVVLNVHGQDRHLLSTQLAQTASPTQLVQLFKRGVRLPNGVPPPVHFQDAWARHEKRVLANQTKSRLPCAAVSKRKM